MLLISKVRSVVDLITMVNENVPQREIRILFEKYAKKYLR